MTFPASPTNGQQATEGGRLFQWNGSNAWELVANVAGHAATHATGGSDPLSLSASQVSGLAAVATSGSASDLSGTLADARLSSNVPLLPSLLLRTSNENASIHLDTVPRTALAFSSLALTSGTIAFAFFTPAVNLTISQIAMATAATAASGLTLARMGLFTFNETTATLVAQTASDTTLFTSTRTIYTRSLSNASGGFPATYTLQAGTRYGVGVICVGTTMPAIAAPTPPFEFCALIPRLSASRASQSDLATVASLGSVSGVPYARLS